MPPNTKRILKAYFERQIKLCHQKGVDPYFFLMPKLSFLGDGGLDTVHFFQVIDNANRKQGKPPSCHISMKTNKKTKKNNPNNK